MSSAKRKSEDAILDDRSSKKAKSVPPPSDSNASTPSQASPAETQKQPENPENVMPVDEFNTPTESEKKRGKRKATNVAQDESDTSKAQYRKLAPPRPFPTVPTSVSATGPRSAHIEGKNYICVTRKTPLGAYLRRCKEAVIKAGYALFYPRAGSRSLTIFQA